MSCILRILGENLDVDSLLALVSLEPDRIWYRGEPRFKTKPNGKVHKYSGATFVTSDADFTEFDTQIEETTRYLRDFRADILKMIAFEGVEEPLLDFGVEFRDVAIHSDFLPITFIREVAESGVSVMLSHYPCLDEDGTSEQDVPAKSDRSGG